MTSYWESLKFHTFLNSAVDGDKWSDSRFGRIILGEKAPGVSWIWVWVYPTVGLDMVAKRKSLPCFESNSRYEGRSHPLHLQSYLTWRKGWSWVWNRDWLFGFLTLRGSLYNKFRGVRRISLTCMSVYSFYVPY